MEMYLITNGKNFLGYQGTKLIAFSQKEKAQKFTESKAQNFMNSLPKSLKNLGYKMVLDADNSITDKEVTNITDNAIYEILEKIKEFESYINRLGVNRDNLSFELSKIDGEIEDLLHAAEFFNLNASEGYKLYKMLHDKRVKRRKIKDYIEIVDYIKKINGKEFAENRGSKSILGMLTRNYNPRVLNELFNK